MLSIILLSYNSSFKLEFTYDRVNTFMTNEKIEYELIIIDDGSTDNSYEIANKLETQNSNIRSFQLSRNFTSHYAIFAGLDVSKGSCAVVIPDDDQMPMKIVVEMYRKWQQGESIIIPYRNSRGDSFLSSFSASLFYKIMNRLSIVNFPPGGSDTFLIDREIIDILNNRISPICTTSLTEILRLGFSPYFLKYDRPEGDNLKSRWTFAKKIKLAKDFFFSSSIFPITFITYTGLICSGFSFFTALIYTYARFFGNDLFWNLNAVPGWTSIIVIISFFSGLILFSLGIISEYIWRIYEEVKNRPGFLIKKDKNGKEKFQ